MPQRILLTGANGFVGRVLAAQLGAQGHEVIGAIAGGEAPAGLPCHMLDIRDAGAAQALVAHLAPQAVIHLAAISHVPTSFQDPQLTWQTNVMGTLNLLEALKREAPGAFLLLVSSSEVYGEAFKAGMPLAEDAPCQPMNPYAASKLAAELACQQYFRQGMAGVIARPFNHIGPGQSPDFATPAFARQIAQIEASGKPGEMKVGNLDASRDFLDVRDVCAAYGAMLELAGRPLEQRVFNIGSGRARRMREVLDAMLAQARQPIEVTLDPARLRPSDVPFAAGDTSRLEALTGWRPAIALEDTLAQLLDHWRAQVAAA